MDLSFSSTTILTYLGLFYVVTIVWKIAKRYPITRWFF